MGGKDTWLSEESILQSLEEAVSRIRKKNLTGSLDTLIYLNFERLLLPAKDSRTLLVVDRGQVFGSERVRETAEQIRLCESAIRASDAERALDAAKAALVRWQRT
ncbi:MAG: hypothetical protein LAP61_28410 [Acidobacteriia bacterium]|nr:hypothetical protein [Terriglobia bacterium]